MGSLLSPGVASGVDFQNPFGAIPFGLAKDLQGFAGPLLTQLGFGGGTPKQQAHRADLLGRATGPEATFIRDVQGLAPTIGPEAQQIGGQISSIGSQEFTSLQSQIQALLGTLPQSQAAAGQGLSEAQQYGRTAFGSESMDPFFQAATDRALQPIRSDFAARGLGDSGAAFAAEQAQRGQLSEDFATQQLGMQAQAPGLIGQAAMLPGEIAGTGINAVGAGLSAIPQLAQALTSQFNIPMQALGSLFQMLTGGIGPGQALLAQTAPQFTPYSGPEGAFGAGGVKR